MENIEQGGSICLLECSAVFDVFKFTVDGLNALRERRFPHHLPPPKLPTTERDGRVKRCLRRLLGRKYSAESLDSGKSAKIKKTNKAADKRASLPAIVPWCIEKIELADGPELDGIYRRSGSYAVIGQLQALFDEGETPSNDMRADARSVADLLKRYVRSMTEPLINKKRQADLTLTYNSNTSNIIRINQFKTILRKLSGPKQALLSVIFLHLGQLLERQSDTKMTAASLAKVWAPNIFGVPSTMSPTLIDKQIALVEFLIVHHATIFPHRNDNIDIKSVIINNNNNALTAPAAALCT